MSSSVDIPWNPATRTIRPRSSASWMRRARTSTIFALPCTVSVTMPAWEPAKETASCPRSLMAIATRAHEMRSPTVRSMSSSRGSGCGETRCASSSSSSVVCPIAETTPTTLAPRAWASTSRRATRLIRSGSPTEVPPNFMTTVPSRLARPSRRDAGAASRPEVTITRLYGEAGRPPPSLSAPAGFGDGSVQGIEPPRHANGSQRAPTRKLDDPHAVTAVLVVPRAR